MKGEEGMGDERPAHGPELEQRERGAASVDLNKIFREDELDLNAMFPDGEMRNFLQQLRLNRRSNERFLEGCKREKLWGEDD